MKWPNTLVLIRHGQSAYNILRTKKGNDPEYREFRTSFENDPDSEKTRVLAESIKAKFSLGIGDYETPLTAAGRNQACYTGTRLQEIVPKSDVVMYSPYIRTWETLREMDKGGYIFDESMIVEDDRIREQEHGLALLFNDWRVFHTFHPEQRALRALLGPYWYQFPQGESVSQVRDRVRSFLGMLIREHSGKNVMVITHHLTILSIRAILERLTPEQFITLDENEKPVNCGVTMYKGDPNQGSDGKLLLEVYNQKLY